MRALTISEASELLGLTVRTIRYWEAEGVYTAPRTRSGQRYYTPEVLDVVRDAIELKSWGLSTVDVRRTLSGNISRAEALELAWETLSSDEHRLTARRRLLEEAKKGASMAEVEPHQREEWDQEARRRYGDEAVDAGNARWNRLSDEQKAHYHEEWKYITTRAAELRRGTGGSSEDRRELTERFVRFLSLVMPVSREYVVGLTQMYELDTRFGSHFDDHEPGTTKLFQEIVAENVDAAMESGL
ncbi:TipAS antibiotic-recognition domain-containing protein [Salininema proteolyticum]|uniref:TipAS antibiotic-recognition domain-containing protein n=1 Tax=Salininema proteolyticum TaxID=1607685 RepID=A0ABV8TUL7_9ACTN